MYLSFVDINILMLTINIINIYFGTWVGLFVLKRWSLHTALFVKFDKYINGGWF